MRKKMRVYISGPITGQSRATTKFNAAAKRIRKMGHIPVNPIQVDKALPDGSYSEYIAIDIILLDLSDAIYMLSGWENSKGARAEHYHAKARGKKIMYEEIDE